MKALIVLLFISFGSLYGRGEGRYSGEFLKIGVGVRATSMGGANVASGKDIEALFLNPAGLSDLSGLQFLAGHNLWLANTQQSFVAGGIPLRNLFLSFGLNYLDSPKIKETTKEDPDGTGRLYSASNICATLGLATKISKGLSCGACLNLLTETIDDVKADGAFLNLGLTSQPKKSKIKYGAVLTGLFLKSLSFIKEESRLPCGIRTGVAYMENKLPITFEADLSYFEDEEFFYATGIEYILGNTMSFQAGYSTRLTDISSGVSFGFGFRKDKIEIRYVFLPSEINTTHRVLILIGEEKKPRQKRSKFFLDL
ncbi:MAG: PorV/PorQ family protein [bacterium]|nr:PorV/PorQ family protein [bacterium]